MSHVARLIHPTLRASEARRRADGGAVDDASTSNNQSAAVPPQGNLLDQARNQYPVLKKYDYGYVEKFQPNAGFLEHWEPGDVGANPSSEQSLDRLRPDQLPLDKPGLEIRDQNTKPIDVLGDIASHHLIHTDPIVKQTYETLQDSLTPAQHGILADQYDHAKKNQGETRSFDDWKNASGMPGFFRGYAFKQWPDEFNQKAYTSQQMKMLDGMMDYLQTGKPRYASGGPVGYAEGGTLDSPAWPGQPAQSDHPAEVASADQWPGQPKQPATGGSWSDTVTESAKGLARGTANFVGDMGEAAMGPFGSIGQSTRAMSNAPEPTEEDIKKFGSRADYYRSKIVPSYGDQIAHATGIDSKKPGYAGSIGEAVGNPASYFGPGGFITKMLMAGASGAGGEAAADAAEGTGLEGPARVAGALVAGPLAARALKPKLAPAQQTLADAGISQMTPGQTAGGMLKNIEDKLTSFPILGDFIQNARGRSIDSFNKAVANQALEPIGAKIETRTPVGHQTIAEVERKLGAKYDSLLPRLNFIPDRQYALDLARIRRDATGMPQPQIEQFERILDARLGPPAPMHGRQLKKIESELTHIGSNYASSADPAQRDLGHSLQDVVRSMRSNLERSNPTYADELSKINSGWAMYARMRAAAANRSTSGGVFSPSDLLSAVKRGDKSAGKGSFARGDALMQDFAEAGQKVLPSKVPDSGTAGRAFTNIAATGGAAYLNPKILAGVAGASAPYLTPSMWLLNRYTRPTTGARAAYSDAGRGAGTLRPMTTTPYGEESDHPYQ